MTAHVLLLAPLALLPLGHPQHHRPVHHRRHRPAVVAPAPEVHQVDTVRIGTPIQVERITLPDGRTITVLHRPGVRVP